MALTPLPDAAAFAALVQTVRTRTTDDVLLFPDDAALAVAWLNVRRLIDRHGTRFAQALRTVHAPGDLKRSLIRRMDTEARRQAGWKRGVTAPTPFLAELAMLWGELARCADAPDLTQVRTTTAPLGDAERATLGAETALAALVPVIGALCELQYGEKYGTPAEDVARLPLPFVLDLIAQVQRLQAPHITAEDRPLGRMNVGASLLPTLGAQLAHPRMLATPDLAGVFEHGYAHRWHTVPRTKDAHGAFIDATRNETATRGTEGLLTVCAASSDGQNRAIAGISPRTPLAVYDKLIYDNSQHVLNAVVQNPAHFNDQKAYAMLDTGLAPQTIAVMKLGKVDMGIRVLACERAIAHPAVDVMHVYEFLRDHLGDETVPPALWHSFILEQHRRLALVRVHGTPEEIAKTERRVQRFGTTFVSELLRDFHKAKKELAQMETRAASSGSRVWERTMEAHRAFLKAREFVGDPTLLNLLVTGVEKQPAVLTELLTLCVEGQLPLTPDLIVAVVMNEDARVREAGLLLMPGVDAVAVERLQGEITTRIQADYAQVRTEVFTHVIPDYEPIEGVARTLSRMHHHFLAATRIPVADLVRTFVTCAERDPRTIPEAFAALTAEMASRARLEAHLAAQTPGASPDAPRGSGGPAPDLVAAPASGTVTQAEFALTPSAAAARLH